MNAPEQIIHKIIYAKDAELLEDVRDRIDDFIGFEDELTFILTHYDKYNSIPDDETYIRRFKIDEIKAVDEPDDYLIAELNRTVLFNNAVDVFQDASNLMQDGHPEDAVELLRSSLETTLSPSYDFADTEILETIADRIYKYEYVNQNQSSQFIPTGFDEIDADIVGLQRGEELVVIYARTNQGKSWMAEAIITHAVEQGYKGGYFSPEMSDEYVGYRFDTLHGNLSNSAMVFGKETDDFNVNIYKEYAEKLKELNGKLYVTTPKSFNRKLTVTKLRQWIRKRNLDIVVIDGITYLTDERFKRGDSKTISLTNISEDLMTLSADVKIPIIVVVQANRGGVVDKTSLDTPELENIRDSDGIAMNASKVYAVRQVREADGSIDMLIDNKKMRVGKMGQSYTYIWDIDTGKFVYSDRDNIDIEKPSDKGVSRKERNDTGGRKRRRNTDEEDF